MFLIVFRGGSRAEQDGLKLGRGGPVIHGPLQGLLLIISILTVVILIIAFNNRVIALLDHGVQSAFLVGQASFSPAALHHPVVPFKLSFLDDPMLWLLQLGYLLYHLLLLARQQ